MKTATKAPAKEAVRLVKTTVWLPEDLVRVSQVIAESVGCDTVDEMFAQHVHDLATQSELAVAEDASDYSPAYAQLKR